MNRFSKGVFFMVLILAACQEEMPEVKVSYADNVPFIEINEKFEIYNDTNDSLLPYHYSSALYSDDNGKTWPVKRFVHTRGGYSHLAAGRPGTPSEGLIYLTTTDLYVRFNLSWVTKGVDWRTYLP